MTMEWFFLVIIAASLGSFYNVLIHRLPRDEDIVYARSHCPKCNHQLKNWHNIPLFSWLILRGKCGFCKAPISFRYPLVELITVLIAMIIFYTNGFNLTSAFVFMSFSMLLVLSVIDIDFHAVPDSINFFAFGFALFSRDLSLTIIDAFVVAGALVLLKFATSYAFKKETMGDGDIIVGATMGALLGYENAFLALFIAAFISVVFHIKIKELPFIPSLSIATLLVFIYGDFTSYL